MLSLFSIKASAIARQSRILFNATDMFPCLHNFLSRLSRGGPN
jgi:hypothetical protein